MDQDGRNVGAPPEVPPLETRGKKAPGWLKFLLWVVTAAIIPFAVSYYLMAVAAGRGEADGNTDFTGTATVSNCVKDGRQFDLVYRCHAVAHLPHDTPGARAAIKTHDLTAPKPVHGVIAVVERCPGVTDGIDFGCGFYDVSQIRSVGWYWVTYLLMPVTVFVSILVILTVRARRDGMLGPAATTGPPESLTQRYADRYGVDLPSNRCSAEGLAPRPTVQPPDQDAIDTTQKQE